jgi:hypothetical protein
MDYSFLRFEDTLIKAKQIKNSPLSSLELNEVIQLLPTEHYLQITNFANGIDFDGDYTALLVDSNDNTKADITENVAIFEFIDNDGTNQIAIELYKLGLDFYKQPLFLKLVHTTSNDVYYSNSFYLTNYEAHKTTRFDYRNNSPFFGIAYNKVDFYQSIRLQTWFAALKNETEIGNYYQISTGNTVSNRPLYKQKELYKSDFMNNFCFERLNSLLLSDIIYMDGVRVTNKTTIKDGEFIGDTNYYKTEFEVFKDYNQNYLPFPFIYEPLAIVNGEPNDIYTLSTLPNVITITLNKSANLSDAFVNLRNQSNTLNINFTNDDITLIGNVATIDISGLISEDGIYFVEIAENSFVKNTETTSFYNFQFEVREGEYEPTEYNNEFLI